MDFERRNRRIANSYYNLGLEKAKIRDLTNSAECLKKSLRFDKYQMDARNLLGLIYYEMGEVADALVQWVISMNLHPENNPADRYLEEIQRKPGRLEMEDQTVKKYNQALWHAQNGSDDLAVLQLMRVVEAKPNFVKAHILLALIYMAHEDYTKAGRSLYKVLQIDKSNAKALWYMSIVKQNTGRAEIEKRKLKNAFSHHQMEDDDIIIPPSYKENTGWQSILNILVGLLLGAAVIFFLVTPTVKEELNQKHNEELTSYVKKLGIQNQDIEDLNKQLEEITGKADSLEGELSTIEGDNNAILAQYQTLIGILQAYRQDDFMTAVSLYASLDTEAITEPSVKAIVDDVTADMTTNGYQILENLGTEAWNAGNKTQAEEYYQKSLAIKPDNPAVMFLLGRLYQGSQREEEANELYNQIMTNYPDSEEAQKVIEARGY